MAFTLVDSATAGANTAVGPFNVAAGDLLVFYVRIVLGPGTLVSIDDGGDNSATLLTKVSGEWGREIQCGYILSAAANAAASFSLTWQDDESESIDGIIAWQFRPDAGETVSVDQAQVSATGSGTLAATGNITTDGTDVVAVAGAWLQDAPNEPDYEIDDVNGDGIEKLGDSNPSWYRILSDTMTGNADISCNSGYWAIWLNSFKSEAAAAASVPIAIFDKHYRMMRAA